MLKYFLSAWKANYGNRLVLAAAIASVSVGGILYFDLIPDIALVSPDSPESDARPPRPAATMLFVAVVTPDSISDTTTGILHIYRAATTFTADTPPIVSRGFQVGGSGVEALVVNELPQGRYTALVFLDLNGNGQLDLDSEGTPADPLRVSQTPESEVFETGKRDASFGLRPAVPVSMTFNFREKSTRTL